MLRGSMSRKMFARPFGSLFAALVVSCLMLSPPVMSGLLRAQQAAAASSSSLTQASDWYDGSPGTSIPAPTWYLPNGYTSGGYATDITVQNPNAVQVTVDFNLISGSTVTSPAALQGFSVPARSSKTFDMGDYVTSGDFSAEVTSTGGNVVCEQVVYGPNGGFAYSALGASTASTTWYMADGCTGGGLQTYIDMVNPGNTAVTLDITFYASSGQVMGPQDYPMPPRSEATVCLNDYLIDWDVSTKVTVTGGGVACWQTMYGQERAWANRSLGAPDSNSIWYLPDGCADANRETWVIVFNPQASEVTIDVSILTEAGAIISPSLQDVPIPAGNRRAFNLGNYVTSLTVSAVVESSGGGVVCESVVYGDTRAWSRACEGATSTSTSWFLPAGQADNKTATSIMVENPNPSAVTVNLKLQTEEGQQAPAALQGVSVYAESCRSFDLNDYFNGGCVSVLVEASDVVACSRSTGGIAFSSFYFAEGYTGDGFDEYLCLMNPNAAGTTAHITYMFSDGSTQVQDVPIGATTRCTVNVNGVVGAGREVSLKVEAEGKIVAERPMYFNYGGAWDGGHDVVGLDTPQTSFYFAEGYTGDGFDEYLCLMNPNTSATTAHVTYMFTDGSTQVQDVPIGATSRRTVKVNDQVGPGRDVSVKVLADAPIVAERPMYFNYQTVCTGGHDVMGAASPQTTSYFAEGYTGDVFDEYICLMNPNASATTAHVTYMFTDGSTQNQDVPLGPTTRATVYVNGIVGDGQSVSAMVESSLPIVAERPMYFLYMDLTFEFLEICSGGHDVMGAPSAQETFYFAEGYTGYGFNEWLCLMNPNGSGASAHITYMFPDGTTSGQAVTIPGTTRLTVNVNDQIGDDREVSVKITSNSPIVAERPMYFFYGPMWSGGHDAVGYTPGE